MTLAPSPLMGLTALSDNTQAVLLLTSPLLAVGSEGSGGVKVLSAGEYGQLAMTLRQTQHQPADLLNGGRDALLAAAPAHFDPERLNQLLSRGFQLGQAIEHWANRSITVISRADEAYPRRYKQRLKHLAPPLLYACGNLALLDSPALAVIGSRSTPEVLLQQTTEIASLAASAGVVIASGAARGVDEAAMLGALSAGGCAIGVVADSLEKMSAKPIWRQGLIDGCLLLLSAEAPSVRFQPWRAMARNKLIYALADAALVMSSDKDRGGTWDGAKEQLTKLRSCPIHVMDDPRGGEGLPAIHEMGARLWPYPSSPEQLKALVAAEPTSSHAPPVDLSQTPANHHAESLQKSLWEQGVLNSKQEPLKSHEGVDSAIDWKPEKSNEEDLVPDSPDANQALSPAEELFNLAKSLILEALDHPKTESDLQELLNIAKPQIREWCKTLVSQGSIRRMNKPVRYIKA
jgi:DNA processing protein